MSTNLQQAPPGPAGHFVEFDEFIDFQLGKAGRGIRATDLLTGIVGGILGVCGYLFLFVVLDHWVIPGGFGRWSRMVLWIIGLAGLASWLSVHFLRPWRGRVNSLFAAREIERTQPDLKSSLLTLIDLKQAGRAAPSQIRSALEKRAAVNLSRADVDLAVNRHTLMRCSYALLGLLVAFCLYAAFSPKSLAQSAWRALVPFSGASAVTRTRIDRVVPGHVTVPSFSQVDLEVELSGEPPKQVLALYSTHDQKFVDEPVVLRDTGEGLRRYRGKLLGEDGRGLRQSMTYRIVAGDAESETFEVQVVQPPSAVADEIAYDYPVYMGLADRTEAGGAIDGWEGTRVTIHATANMPVKSGSVLFSDSDDTKVKAEEIPLIIDDGTELSAQWTLAFRSDGTFPKYYRLMVRNEAGHTDPQPVLYPIRIRGDQAPKIELLSPLGDVTAPANGSVSVAWRASDPDFALHSVEVHFEQEGRELSNRPKLFEGPPDQPAAEGVYTIPLRDMNLSPGSRLTFWLAARDNFEPFGTRSANQTVTARLNIDIVAPALPENVQQQSQQSQETADNALEQSHQAGTDHSGQEAAEAIPSDEELRSRQERPDTTGEATPDEGARETEPTDQAIGGQTDRGQDTQSTDDSHVGQSSETAGHDAVPPKPDEAPGSTTPPSDRDPDDTMNEGPEQPGRNGANAAPPSGEHSQTSSTQAKRPQAGSRNEASSGERNSAPESNGERKPTPSPENRAHDDEALDRLMKWNEKKGGRQDETRPQPRPPGGSGEDDRPDPKDESAEKAPDDEKPSQDAGSGSKRPTGSEPKGSRPTEPGRADERNSTANGESPVRDDMPNDRAAESADENDHSSNENKKPNPEGGSSSGTEPDAKSAANRDPLREPSPSDHHSETGEPSEASSGANPKDPASQERATETSDEHPASAPHEGTTPNDEGSTGAADSPEASAEKSAEPRNTGEPKPESAESPTQSPSQQPPMPRDNPAKSPSKDEPEKSGPPMAGESSPANPGETNQTSKGEPTKGASDERRNPSNESSRSEENRGKPSEQPVGQPDEGARSGGEGNSGSSTAGKTGDQTSSGPGEPGKSGSKNGSSSQGNRPGETTGAKSAGNAKPGNPDQPPMNSSNNSANDKASGQADAPADQTSSSPSREGKGSPSPKSNGEAPTAPKASEGAQENASQSSRNSEEEGSGKNPSPGQGASNDDPASPSSGESPAAGGQSSEKPAGEGANRSESASQPTDKPSGDAPQPNAEGGAKNADGAQGQGAGKGQGASEQGAGGQASEGGRSQSGGPPGSGSGAGGAKSMGTPGAAGAGTAGNGRANRGEGDDSVTADAADLENRKKAASLALKRLKETLERGDIDPALQKELGFSDEDLSDFMNRLEARLADTGEDQSPEARARRRQFESMLRSLEFDPESEARGGKSSEKQAAGFAAPRRPAPPEYKASESEYRKRFTEQRRSQ